MNTQNSGESELKGLTKPKFADKWVKELVGVPTYFGAAILGMGVSGGNILIVFLVLTPFVIIYNMIYPLIVPQYKWTNHKFKLAIFFVAEVLIWSGIVYFARATWDLN